MKRAVEEDLIRRFKTGEKEVFAVLVAPHKPFFYKTIYYFLRCDPETTRTEANYIFDKAKRGLNKFKEAVPNSVETFDGGSVHQLSHL